MNDTIRLKMIFFLLRLGKNDNSGCTWAGRPGFNEPAEARVASQGRCFHHGRIRTGKFFFFLFLWKKKDTTSTETRIILSISQSNWNVGLDHNIIVECLWITIHHNSQSMMQIMQMSNFFFFLKSRLFASHDTKIADKSMLRSHWSD